jgi:hypothetical protein
MLQPPRFVELATHLLLVARRRKAMAKSEPDPNFGTIRPSRGSRSTIAPNNPLPDPMKCALSAGLYRLVRDFFGNARTYGIYISCAFVPSRFFMCYLLFPLETAP